MNINSFIDAIDVAGVSANTWYFLNSIDGGNNSGIVFTPYWVSIPTTQTPGWTPITT